MSRKQSKAEQEEVQRLTKLFFAKCREQFPFFCRKSLDIRSKSGEQIKLRLNAAQLMVHEKLEAQLQETGRVRAIIIKGRQQGQSTLIQARFFWKLIHSRGLQAYILTHLSDSTRALFAMSKRFFEGLPLYKPVLGKCNQNELAFDDIGCGYKVGTAGSSGVGRGETIQLFHGSECGYWANAEDHLAGILQAVPEEKGTEIILESTANGTGNVFHKMSLEAMRESNGFQMIFVPWTLQEEYKIESDESFVLTEKEKELKGLYPITDAQLKWRRAKINQLGDERKFRQEYPLSVQDAFIADTERAYLLRAEVEVAANPPEPVVADRDAPIIMGIDPARLGGDVTGIAIRCGRILDCVSTLPKQDTMSTVGSIIRLINTHKPDRVYIDLGSFGAAIYDRLREQRYHQVHGVNFGGQAEDIQRYGNKRAEMYARIKEWLGSPPCQIPNDEVFKMELTAMNFFENSSGKLMMEKKEDMRKRGVSSPNLADAFALTFAEVVVSNDTRYHGSQTITASYDWNPYKTF